MGLAAPARRITITLTVVAALVAGVVPSAGPAAAHVAVPPGPSLPAGVDPDTEVTRLLVTYTDDDGRVSVSDARAETREAAADTGVALQYERPVDGDTHVVRLPEETTVAEAVTLAEELEAGGAVEHVFPDVPAQPMLVPNDPSFPDQWHYAGGATYGINAPPAWDVTTGSPDVVVAVLDTGYRPHADLDARYVAGYDMVSNATAARDGDGRDADPLDEGDWCHDGARSSWHGTHVAGTIGAHTDNGIGVAGVDWNARIQPVRVLAKCGGSFADILDGIRWAAGLPVVGVPANPTPAKVLNLSLGGTWPCEPVLQQAIDEAIAAGAVIVVSAGNNDADAATKYPGNCNGVVTVGATGPQGYRSYYSNWGPSVEISAPGGAIYSRSSEGVLSTLNAGTTTAGADHYAWYQGTSMAAPHISGIVSLMAAVRPGITASEVTSLLQETARAFPAATDCSMGNFCGAGIADAGAAVALAAAPGAIVQVATPNGGERWSTGTTRTITWRTFGALDGTVKIQLLRDGLPAATIAKGLPASGGRFAWRIPVRVPSTNTARIRVVSESDPTVTDTSDAPFRLVRTSVTVKSPNTKVTWRRGTTRTIKWSSSGSPGWVYVEVMRGSRKVRTLGAVSVDGSTGSFSWYIDRALPPGSNYRIRVRSATTGDVGNAYFTLR